MKRDPVLVMRAQRAAAALEQAFDRWRKLHGLGPEPLPQLSSYVGYSFEEPYGQPRVVLGVAAEEAEHLTALLQGHECYGPADTEVRPAVRQNGAHRPAGSTGELPRGGGRVRLPAQPAAGAEVSGAAERHALPGPTAAGLPPEGSPGQVSPLDGGRRQPPMGPRDGGIPFGQATIAGPPGNGIGPRPTPSQGPVPPQGSAAPQLSSMPRHILQPPVMQPQAEPATVDTQMVRLVPHVRPVDAADTGQSSLVAFRPHPAPESYPEETQEPEFLDEDVLRDKANQPTTGRGHRQAERHPMPWLQRQKRSAAHASRDGSSPSRAADAGVNGKQQDGKDRKSLTSMAAELAGWAASELPNQLSHRRQGNGRAADDADEAPGEAGHEGTGWPGQDQVS
jgi:hypothetical protein